MESVGPDEQLVNNHIKAELYHRTSLQYHGGMQWGGADLGDQGSLLGGGEVGRGVQRLGE